MADRRGVSSNRTEWEWPAQQDLPNLDRLATVRMLRRVVPKIRGRLKPLFVTEIRRTVRLLHLDGGTVVEASLDQGTIKSGARREAVNELELELKAGRIGPMYRLAAALQKMTRSWISPESKFVRGLRLRTNYDEAAQKTQTILLKPRSAAADGFHEIVGTALGHLIANIPQTLRGSAEGLHQMRVALRETRAALQLFEPLLNTSIAKPFDAKLQRLGHLFGKARDWDVFCLETLPAATRDLRRIDLSGLGRVAECERQLAHRMVADAVKGSAFSALVLGIALWAETGLTKPHALGEHMHNRLGRIAPTLLDRIHRRARRKARHVSHLTPPDLHSLRKSLKRVRYDTQSFNSLFTGRAVKVYREGCKGVLEILGAINDAAMTRRLARTLSKDSWPNLAAAEAALERWNRRRVAKSKSRLKAAVKTFKRAPVFWS
jgi:inorganic triphosphatase YgiF